MKNQAEVIKFLQDHNLGDADEASAIIDDAEMYIDSELIEDGNDYMDCADHDTHMVLDEKAMNIIFIALMAMNAISL